MYFKREMEDKSSATEKEKPKAKVELVEHSLD